MHAERLSNAVGRHVRCFYEVSRGSKLGKSGQNWSKSTKIAPKTAEKRLKSFALTIKHDEAHHMHVFDHHGPWYHQRTAISAPTGPPVTGCSGPENASFFETAAGHIGGIDANPLSECGAERGLFLNLCPYPAPPTVRADPNACRAPLQRRWMARKACLGGLPCLKIGKIGSKLVKIDENRSENG
jgi:hypothetical protein